MRLNHFKFNAFQLRPLIHCCCFYSVSTLLSVSAESMVFSFDDAAYSSSDFASSLPKLNCQFQFFLYLRVFLLLLFGILPPFKIVFSHDIYIPNEKCGFDESKSNLKKIRFAQYYFFFWKWISWQIFITQLFYDVYARQKNIDSQSECEGANSLIIDIRIEMYWNFSQHVNSSSFMLPDLLKYFTCHSNTNLRVCSNG